MICQLRIATNTTKSCALYISTLGIATAPAKTFYEQYNPISKCYRRSYRNHDRYSGVN
jgi:hypothetical protein